MYLDILENPMQPLKENVSEARLKAPGYAFEVKYDGTSVRVAKLEDKIYIVNRDGVHYEGRGNLPELMEDVAKFPQNTVIQGEACYIENGEAVFVGSQRRCSKQSYDPALVKQYPIQLMTYDILMLNGVDVRDKTYLERKRLLSNFIMCGDFQHIVYVPHVLDDGTELYENSTEGIISKRVDGVYFHGRSHGWLKKKHRQTETFNVIGYTEGEGTRADAFGALVLATVDGVYVGNVGTCRGFQHNDLVEIGRRLRAAPILQHKPFLNRVVGENYTAIKINLKAKVEFMRYTPDGHVREPVVIGIEAEDCVEKQEGKKPLGDKFLTLDGDILF